MNWRRGVANAFAALSLGSLGFAQAAMQEGSVENLRREIAELRQRLHELEARATVTETPLGLEKEIADFSSRFRSQAEAGGNVSAPGIKSLTIGGDARFRPEWYHRRTFTTKESERIEDLWLYRLRVNLGLDIDDKTKAFAQLYQSGEFGTDTEILAHPFGSSADQEAHFRQFYVDFADVMDFGWDLRIGRQVLEYGEGRILSEYDWAQFTNVFEGIKASSKFDEVSVDLLAMKVFEDFFADPTNTMDDDVNLWGAYVAWAGEDLSADFYSILLEANSSFTSSGGLFTIAGEQNLWTVGTRVAGKADMLDWGFEVAGQQNERTGGSTSHVRLSEAYGLHGHVGVASNEDVPVGVRLDYNDGSEDFTNLFPDVHRHAGLMDIFTNWGNLREWAASINGNLQENWDWGAAYRWFQQHEEPSGGDRNLGYELDVWLTGACTDHLKVTVGYGHFFPRSAINDTPTPSQILFPWATNAALAGASDAHDADLLYVNMVVPF